MPLLHEVHSLVERVELSLRILLLKAQTHWWPCNPRGVVQWPWIHILDLVPHQQCACEWWWSWAALGSPPPESGVTLTTVTHRESSGFCPEKARSHFLSLEYLPGALSFHQESDYRETTTHRHMVTSPAEPHPQESQQLGPTGEQSHPMGQLNAREWLQESGTKGSPSWALPDPLHHERNWSSSFKISECWGSLLLARRNWNRVFALFSVNLSSL